MLNKSVNAAGLDVSVGPLDGSEGSGTERCAKVGGRGGGLERSGLGSAGIRLGRERREEDNVISGGISSSVQRDVFMVDGEMESVGRNYERVSRSSKHGSLEGVHSTSALEDHGEDVVVVGVGILIRPCYYDLCLDSAQVSQGHSRKSTLGSKESILGGFNSSSEISSSDWIFS